MEYLEYDKLKDRLETAGKIKKQLIEIDFYLHRLNQQWDSLKNNSSENYSIDIDNSLNSALGKYSGVEVSKQMKIDLLEILMDFFREKRTEYENEFKKI